MEIKFIGAAREVTGSKHLITTRHGKKILLDCGMFQGKGLETDSLNRNTMVDPAEIDHIILTHAHVDHSGLIPYFNAYFLDSVYQADKDKKHYTTSQAYLVDSICRSKRLNKPGEKVRYSCLNFITLQQIVESITGKSMASICPFYRPVEMQPEQFTTPLEQIAPTEKLKDGTIIRGQVHDPMARILMKGVSGNAGVFMNAEQLAEWCIYFMSIPAEQREAGCNAGLWKGENNSLSHSGYTGTYVRLYPDTHDAIIILGNRVHPEDKGDLSNLRKSIIEAFRK